MLRKLHLAVDANTHEVICADLSLNNVTDTEAFPAFMTQNGATTSCGAKKIKALIPPWTRSGYWPTGYADRNQVVARQRLMGNNAYWKCNTAYNWRSVAETAIYRVKRLFGGHLTLHDYDAQAGEAMAMIRALNKMTRGGMPERVRIVWKSD